MPSLAAFVITFDRPQVLAATLRELLAQSRAPEAILVLDNGAGESTRDAARSVGDPRVEYRAMEGNAGPAGAAAHGLRELTGRGFDWVYWGDDDDPPKTPDTLARLVELGTSNGPDVGAVGAVGTRWDWERGRVYRLPDEALEGAVEVDTIAGSSQLVIAATAVRDVGLPDAELFFGFEEPEYCLRLRRAGKRLLVDGELMLEYRRQAGRLGFEPKTPLRPQRAYSEIWRQYYSTRNYVFSMRNNFERPDLAWREVRRAAARMLGAWAHGPRYGARFARLQTRALVDGYRGRLGCTVLPEREDSAA